MLDPYVKVLVSLWGYWIWWMLIHDFFPPFKPIEYGGSLYISTFHPLSLLNMMYPYTWVLISLWGYWIWWILIHKSLMPFKGYWTCWVLIHEFLPHFAAIEYDESLYQSSCCTLRLLNIIDPYTRVFSTLWDYWICRSLYMSPSRSFRLLKMLDPYIWVPSALWGYVIYWVFYTGVFATL